jgi:hypothetical protein
VSEERERRYLSYIMESIELVDEEQRHGNRYRRAHDEEHIEVGQPKPVVDHVVLIHPAGGDDRAERGTEEESDTVHSAPPEIMCRKPVTTMAVTNNVPVAAKLAGERDEVPHRP